MCVLDLWALFSLLERKCNLRYLKSHQVYPYVLSAARIYFINWSHDVINQHILTVTFVCMCVCVCVCVCVYIYIYIYIYIVTY
jgi:hypothetical protein